MAQGALPGFRDFYPEQFAERAHIMGVWRDVARRFAFSEYDGPPLEPLELYTKKSGEEIVGQLYNFVDKAGREITLRPEMTPTLARMAAAKANALRKPIRWFSVPQLFRYERRSEGHTSPPPPLPFRETPPAPGRAAAVGPQARGKSHRVAKADPLVLRTAAVSVRA